MCDALAANLSEKFEAIVVNCLAHSRRKYFDVYESFPEECRYVIDTLRAVYEHDAKAKDFSAQERLFFHQIRSKPLLDKLEKWLKD